MVLLAPLTSWSNDDIPLQTTEHVKNVVFIECPFLSSGSHDETFVRENRWVFWGGYRRISYYVHIAHSCATCALHRDSRHASRKLRGRVEGCDSLSGVADSMLRLCPALEARISDLRRDNTAAAQFMSKAQVHPKR